MMSAHLTIITHFCADYGLVINSKASHRALVINSAIQCTMRGVPTKAYRNETVHSEGCTYKCVKEQKGRKKCI